MRKTTHASPVLALLLLFLTFLNFGIGKLNKYDSHCCVSQKSYTVGGKFKLHLCRGALYANRRMIFVAGKHVQCKAAMKTQQDNS